MIVELAASVALTGLANLLMPKGPSDMGVSPPCGPPPHQGSGGRKPSGISGVPARSGYGALTFSEVRLREGFSTPQEAREDVIHQVMRRTQPFPQRACNCPGCGAPKLGSCSYCGRP